jgi:hypothetical protein
MSRFISSTMIACAKAAVLADMALEYFLFKSGTCYSKEIERRNGLLNYERMKQKGKYLFSLNEDHSARAIF